MAGQVERTLGGVQIHDEMNDLEHKMASNVADHKLAAVDHLDISFVTVGLVIERLVHVGIHLPPALKVCHGLLGIGIAIVRCGCLDSPNVLLEQRLVVADALDENDPLGPDAGIGQTLQDVLPAHLLAVGGIKDGNATSVLLDVLDGVVEGGVASHSALCQGLGVAVVVKVGRLVGPAQLAAVVADVEDLRGDGVEEAEEAADALSHVGLSGGWQTDHDQDELVGIPPCATDDVERGGILALWDSMRRRVVEVERPQRRRRGAGVGHGGSNDTKQMTSFHLKFWPVTRLCCFGDVVPTHSV